MKTKRTVIIVSLVAAILCAGIGFAAINDQLTVTGKVSVGANDFAPNVHFLNDGISVDYSVANGASTGVTYDVVDESSDAGDDLDKFTITVPSTVLTSKDDKVTVVVPITNASDTYRAKVTLNSEASVADGLYSVTCSWNDGSSNPAIIDKSGSRKEVAIEIKLLKTPTSAINNNTFSITYTAEAVQ